MDARTLLNAIGNALYQECLIWMYETSTIAAPNGKLAWQLHVVLANTDASELIIETFVDTDADALFFRSKSTYCELARVCCEMQVDLSDSEYAREFSGMVIVTPAMAVDMTILAFAKHLESMRCSELESPERRLSTLLLFGSSSRPKHEA